MSCRINTTKRETTTNHEQSECCSLCQSQLMLANSCSHRSLFSVRMQENAEWFCFSLNLSHLSLTFNKVAEKLAVWKTALMLQFLCIRNLDASQLGLLQRCWGAVCGCESSWASAPQVLTRLLTSSLSFVQQLFCRPYYSMTTGVSRRKTGCQDRS